jgi:L-iditol 2-dehydrogenase
MAGYKNETMKAGVLINLRKIVVKEVAKSKSESRDVLIKVKACGICTTDRRFYSGKSKVTYPVILGHEISGIVEDVDREVSIDLKPQDHVAIGPAGCGQCYYCRRGEVGYCSNPFPTRVLASGEHLLIGGFAEYLSLPSGNIYKIPNKLNFRETAFVEPLSCVIHSIKRANILFGDVVGVIGAGPMGLLHLLLAKKFGATVILSEPDNQRRALAEELGADFTINPSKENLSNFVKKYTEGKGVNAVIIAAPGENAINQGIGMVGKLGRIIFYASNHPPLMVKIPSTKLHYDQVILTGSYNWTKKDFEESILLLSSKAINVIPLISKVISLDDIEKGFKLTPKGNIQRVLVENK